MIDLTLMILLDICYLTTLYLYIGFLFSDIINELFGYFDPEQINDMSTMHLLVSTTIQFWLIAISAYIIRNIVSIIPNPFDGFLGDHESQRIIPEASGGVIISFILFLLQNSLRDKLLILHKRVNIL